MLVLIGAIIARQIHLNCDASSICATNQANNHLLCESEISVRIWFVLEKMVALMVAVIVLVTSIKKNWICDHFQSRRRAL
jgi:phosphatidylserine decarboxylase